MRTESFQEQFEREIAVVRGALQSADLQQDGTVSDAYVDLSQTLGLTYPCVALLAWALGNMYGMTLDTDSVSSLIGYPEEAVNTSLDELERRRYMIRIDSEDYTVDVTKETKERIIDHYCFGKLMNS